jgi:D-sedoheptulose 7-phosphate isomerase
MNIQEKITTRISESIAVKSAILDDAAMISKVDEIVKVIVHSLQNGNKVMLCGNGGSAADAQHLAAELSGRFYRDRKALSVEALHCNTSYLTAVANDYGFEEIYARLIEGMGKPGDVLIGLSTSGNSPNIVKALKVAKDMGLVTIAFTGESDGKLGNHSDHIINIPSSNTPRIQEGHMLLGHIICELVESTIFG